MSLCSGFADFRSASVVMGIPLPSNRPKVKLPVPGEQGLHLATGILLIVVGNGNHSWTFVANCFATRQDRRVDHDLCRAAVAVEAKGHRGKAEVGRESFLSWHKKAGDTPS